MSATIARRARALPHVDTYLTNGTALVRVTEVGADAVWVEDAVTFRERKLASARLYRTWRPVECDPLPLPEHLMEGDG